VPAKGGALVPRILFVSEQERQLERLGQSDQLELGSSRERFRGVAAIESSAEAHERGALRGRERVFAPGVTPRSPRHLSYRRRRVKMSLRTPAVRRLIGRPLRATTTSTPFS
jgi:hypothetical protein